MDLVFPHHENEVAQSESATGVEPFVRYWIHTGFLTVEGEKMSKSLGNFTTVAAALAEWRPEALRLWFAGTHYRSQIDYSLVALGQAAKNIERFVNMLANAEHAKASARHERKLEDDTFLALVEKRRHEFEAAMDDDLNTPKALATLFDLSTDINKYLADPQAQTLESALKTFHKLESVFDILPDKVEQGPGDVAPLLDLLLESREAARARKDFATSDRIRDRLGELGYVIEDAGKGKGPRWRHK
jgi:cysteinyl-tRNA synthetase